MQSKHTQDAINEKLDAGVKDKILDALEFGSKELGHLLHHFQKVKIDDPKAFQRNAPKTDDFFELVEKGRPMIHRILDERLENNQEPFFNDHENLDGLTLTMITKKIKVQVNKSKMIKLTCFLPDNNLAA